MMKTIELKKEKIYYGTLLLVNAHYPLKSNDMKSLVPADVRFPDILMKRDAANVLQLYVPADDDKTQIDIPEQCVYQISGNNIDGFIMTIWRKNYD